MKHNVDSTSVVVDSELITKLCCSLIAVQPKCFRIKINPPAPSAKGTDWRVYMHIKGPSTVFKILKADMASMF